MNINNGVLKSVVTVGTGEEREIRNISLVSLSTTVSILQNIRLVRFTVIIEDRLQNLDHGV